MINVNEMFNCENCAKADAYGRGCKEHPLLPVVLMMGGHRVCERREPCSYEQLLEREREREEDKLKHKQNE